nr:hypothetical protein [Actinomycetota bacterium]
MAPVWARVRADARTGWRAWAALTLLVGLLGGGVTAAAAGARRTDSAFPRFVVATKAPDLLSFSNSNDPTFAKLPREQLVALPEVADAADAAAYSVVD